MIAVEPAPLRDPVAIEMLTEQANDAHVLVVSAEASALQHAMEAGDLLMQIREYHYPRQTWNAWLRDEFTGSKTAAIRYIRLARFRDEVEASDCTTIHGAIDHLTSKGLKSGNGKFSYTAASEEVMQEACALVEDGVTITEAARSLGFPRLTVREWVEPDYRLKRAEWERNNRERKKAKKQAEAAKKAAERDARRLAELRRKKGLISEAYSLGRKIGQCLQQAHDEAETPEIRAAVGAALDAYAKLNDAMWDAHLKGQR